MVHSAALCRVTAFGVCPAAAAQVPPAVIPPLNPQPVQAPVAVAGPNGGPLGGFLLQPQQQQPPLPAVSMPSQMLQLPPQPPPQQPPSGGLPGSLAALLGNPAMLSAAIMGQATAASSAPPAPAPMVAGAGADGMQLLLNPNPVAAVMGTSLFGGPAGTGFGTGGMDLGQAAFGGLGSMDPTQSGFADEGDDPYDPLEG